MSKITDERLAEIANGSAETVYYGWPQKLVAEEAKKLAQLLEELREGFRVHDAGWKAANIENERWRRNSIETWEAMQSMRNSINEYIPMPSLESDLLQGPENSVFCASVAKAVIAHVTEPRSQPAGVRVKGLRWVEVNSIAEQFASHTIVGTYFAVRNDRGWKLELSAEMDSPEKLGLFLSCNEAKAAAEADYRQRILSALEPQQEEAVAELTEKQIIALLITHFGHAALKPPIAFEQERDGIEITRPTGSVLGLVRAVERASTHPTPTQKEQESQRVSEDRIRGLEDVLAEKRECINNQRARIEALSAKLKEAEAALEPFAHSAGFYARDGLNESEFIVNVSTMNRAGEEVEAVLKRGDFARARLALQSIRED